MKCTCKDIAIVIRTACQEISLIGFFALLFMLTSNREIKSHPTPEDVIFDTYHTAEINYRYSNLFNNQIDVGYSYINTHGLYKKFEGNVLKFNYGINFDENNFNHRFRFLLVDYQGLFYKNLLQYGKLYQKNSGKYLFHQFGFKLGDWNNLDMLKSDFTPIKLNYDLILENRSYQDVGLNGLNYFSNKHNVYLHLTPNIGVSKINATNIFDKTESLENELTFWDVDYGINAKLGYELKIEKEDIYFDRIGRESKSYTIYHNSLAVFLNYRNFAYNQFSIIEYGLKANFSFSKWIGFRLIYSINNFYIDDNQKESNQIKLNYTFKL